MHIMANIKYAMNGSGAFECWCGQFLWFGVHEECGLLFLDSEISVYVCVRVYCKDTEPLHHSFM